MPDTTARQDAGPKCSLKSHIDCTRAVRAGFKNREVCGRGWKLRAPAHAGHGAGKRQGAAGARVVAGADEVRRQLSAAGAAQRPHHPRRRPSPALTLPPAAAESTLSIALWL